MKNLERFQSYGADTTVTDRQTDEKADVQTDAYGKTKYLLLSLNKTKISVVSNIKVEKQLGRVLKNKY